MLEGKRELSGVSSVRALIPFTRPHDLITCQRPHTLTPSHWPWGFRHLSFWGDANIQSVAPSTLDLTSPDVTASHQSHYGVRAAEKHSPPLGKDDADSLFPRAGGKDKMSHPWEVDS